MEVWLVRQDKKGTFIVVGRTDEPKVVAAVSDTMKVTKMEREARDSLCAHVLLPMPEDRMPCIRCLRSADDWSPAPGGGDTVCQKCYLELGGTLPDE